MGDYDYQSEYDNFDNGDFDSLGNTQDYNGMDSGDYQAPFQTQQSNNNGGYDFNSEYNNFSQDDWSGLGNNTQYQPQQMQPMYGSDMEYNPMANYTGPQGGYGSPQERGFDWAKLGSGFLNAFGNSAQGAAQSASVPALAKLFSNFMAASQEKKSNQQMAQQIPQQVQQLRQQTSPFDNPAQVDPNSMRGLAQSGYRQSMADPYSSPIVANQVAAINAQQARMDAKAGRRSNLAASTPEALAAQAKVASAYQKQLGDQAGAGQFMGTGGLEQLVSALKYGAQGNAPFYSALGTSLQGNNYTGNPNLSQAFNNQQQQYRG